MRECFPHKPVVALLTLLLWGALCLHACPLKAASSLRVLSEDNREITWNLSADRMITVAGGSILEAFGKVELRMGGDYLRADFARYFPQTNWVYLYGNVELVFGQDRLNAREAELDLRSRTGWLTDGRIFMAESNSYFWGERITRHRGNVYSFKEIKFTTCDGDTPAWSFEADNAVLEINGYAQLWGSSFQVADQSVLYSPYLIVPAKTERQSGFLVPDFGKSSKTGYFYTQPFFWVIDDSRDATIYESYMSKRGFMHGITYRSRASEDENLWLAFDYLDDRQTVRSDDNDEYYDGDGLNRQNSSRYWVRGMYDWRMPGDPLWRLRADIDYTSDQYFLRDFKRNVHGYTNTRSELFKTFSRDIKDEAESRKSALMFFRDWERVGLYLSASYTQDPSLGYGNPVPRSQDTTVQHLPELNLYLQQARIVDSLPFEVRGSAQAAYMYRREGTSGTRFDLSPRLVLPLSGRYGSIITGAQLHSTWYSTESKDDTQAQPGTTTKRASNSSRYMPEVDIKASTEFSRVYGLSPEPLNSPGDTRWTGLRHSIVPRLAYRYEPERDQSRNPQYTDYDNLAPVHEITYSLDNVLTRKRESRLARTVKDEQGKNQTETYSNYDYQDVVRLRLEQSFDINEARRDDDLDLYDREPWRDFMAELTFYIGDYFSWSSTSYWTPNQHKFTQHVQSIGLTVPTWGNFSASFKAYEPIEQDAVREGRDDRLTTLDLAANMHIYGPWSASAYYDWGIKGDSKDEKGLTLNYKHQCYSLSGQVIRDDDDTIVRFWFSLTGLGL